MADTEIEQVIRQFYDTVLGGGSVPDAEKLLLPEFRVTSRGGFVAAGIEDVPAKPVTHEYSVEGLTETVRRFHATFPDARIKIESVEPEGPAVRVFSSLVVTARGEEGRSSTVVFHNKDLVQIDADLRITGLHREIPRLEVHDLRPPVGEYSTHQLLAETPLPARLLMMGIGPLPGFPDTLPPEDSADSADAGPPGGFPDTLPPSSSPEADA